MASRWARLRSSNSSKLRACRLKSWITAMPRNGLSEIGVDTGDAGADQAVGLARLDAEDVDGQQEQWDHRHRHQGQPDVERKHDGDDGRDEDQVGHQVDGPGGEHLLQHLHVRGHTGS